MQQLYIFAIKRKKNQHFSTKDLIRESDTDYYKINTQKKKDCDYEERN